MPAMKQVTIYTDGACSGNPGPGGWGAVLIYDPQDEEASQPSKARRAAAGGAKRQMGYGGQGPHIKELSGGESGTTNNRMEMMGAIEALRALKSPCRVVLYTDSSYVQKGMTEWLPGWRARGWKTADKKPVKNADLWQILATEAARHQVEWKWVKGHNGDPMNELADRLATGAIPK